MLPDTSRPFSFLLSGCIGESLEGCPLDILLQFTYKPTGRLPTFSGTVCSE